MIEIKQYPWGLLSGSNQYYAQRHMVLSLGQVVELLPTLLIQVLWSLLSMTFGGSTSAEPIKTLVCLKWAFLFPKNSLVVTITPQSFCIYVGGLKI